MSVARCVGAIDGAGVAGVRDDGKLAALRREEGGGTRGPGTYDGQRERTAGCRQ